MIALSSHAGGFHSSCVCAMGAFRLGTDLLLSEIASCARTAWNAAQLRVGAAQNDASNVGYSGSDLSGAMMHLRRAGRRGKRIVDSRGAAFIERPARPCDRMQGAP